jgi:hypothetical protein
VVNCAFGSSSTAVGFEGRYDAKKIVQIDNCYIEKTLVVQTIMTGSYVKNSIIDGGVSLDCWVITDQMFVFENTTVTGSITSATGRTHFTFIDCTFDPSKLGLGSDGGGACSLQAITSPTCTEAGSKIVYGAGDKVGTVDNDFPTSDEGKALGHNADPNKVGDIYYESYLEKGEIATCIRCGEIMVDKSLKAEPLFIFLGYSTPEDGSYGIVASFIVNVKAIEIYEKKTGKSLNYGIVAAAKDNLGEQNPLDVNGDAITLTKGSVVKAEITREYASYDFVLTGMNENQLDIELVIATYVTVTENNETSVVYLQETQKTDTLSAISYNAILKEA